MGFLEVLFLSNAPAWTSLDPNPVPVFDPNPVPEAAEPDVIDVWLAIGELWLESPVQGANPRSTEPPVSDLDFLNRCHWLEGEKKFVKSKYWKFFFVKSKYWIFFFVKSKYWNFFFVKSKYYLEDDGLSTGWLAKRSTSSKSSVDDWVWLTKAVSGNGSDIFFIYCYFFFREIALKEKFRNWRRNFKCVLVISGLSLLLLATIVFVSILSAWCNL